jgi:hypothetical protein
LATSSFRRYPGSPIGSPLPPAAEREERPMPEGSTKKQKRQYEHIKESYQDKGVSAGEAKERAARTVNKQRGKSKKDK